LSNTKKGFALQSAERILQLATEHHMAGRAGEAEQLYREILSSDPRNASALHRMGILALQRSDNISAIDFLERALKLQPDVPEALFGLGLALQSAGDRQRAVEVYQKLLRIKPDNWECHNNLGNALFGLGRIAEAAGAYRKAIEVNPECVDALGNLGSALNALGRFDEGIEVFRRGLAIKPDSPVLLTNLGNALCGRKRYPEAIIALRRAIQLKPDFAQALYNLGNALAGTADYAGAVEMFRRAVQLVPDYIDAHNNLGNALQALRDYKGAAEAYLAALKIRPDFLPGYNNLGNALRTMSKTDEAIAALQQALRLRPDYAPAHCNLGNALKDAGRLGDAIECYRRAVTYDPRDFISHSNMIFTMQYHPECAPEEILREALRWNVLHAQRVSSEIKPHQNERNPDRRLRIGYVGADFRDHCQSLFTIPLFAGHDRQNFEIFCYSQVGCSDSTTEQIRQLVDHFEPIIGKADRSVAGKIREDGIDILVDLTMHMSHGRSLVFARKPAPVQVAWLAYPGTTGLSAMDYRLTDPHLDPAGVEHLYSEKTVRLPETFWCYDPNCFDLSPGALPAIQNGFITFGCLNNFCKVTPRTLDLWLPVLKSVPNSRLVLLAAYGGHRDAIRQKLSENQIDSDRVEFLQFQPRRGYLEVYQRIDIGLDTLPYNGHTTSLDSLWMGVPVVTRIGSTVVGRAGWSQLRNLNLQELAAETDEQFRSIVVELSRDLDRLADLRQNLRQRMMNSPLMDSPRFARNMEAAYRAMWRNYCQSK
jgi:protein O-GlcNAc transferase